MTVRLSQPDHISVHLAGATSPHETEERPIVSAAAGAVIRGGLVGASIGMLLLGGHSGIGSIVAIGVLALGAALVSWDP